MKPIPPVIIDSGPQSSRRAALDADRSDGGVGGECPSRSVRGHLGEDALPQLLLAVLGATQALQNLVELHHAHGREAEGGPRAADETHKVVVVRRADVVQAMLDALSVRLLAALNELAERGRAQVPVQVGWVLPGQVLHRFQDQLLQHERTQEALGGAHAELVHVADAEFDGEAKQPLDVLCVGWAAREDVVGVVVVRSPSQHPQREHPDSVGGQ